MRCGHESNPLFHMTIALPGATATGFWDTAGTPVEQVPREMVMNADEMVDAALLHLPDSIGANS